MFPKIRIFTFGALQVIRDDRAVSEGDWHTRQARQLLKILITERPRAVSADRLIEILWPNSTPAAASTTLRSAINALRNVLEPDRFSRAPSRYVITQAPGYAFQSQDEISLDVDIFEHHLELARRHDDATIQQSHLEAAIALYKDDYLISDPYADWAQNERERLQELFFHALLRLAEIRAMCGEYPAAIAACRQVLARDEIRENAYQSLMRYQAESGDSAAALMTYERCRTLLAEELGADPSPVTQSLHQNILNGEIETSPNSLLFHLGSSRGPHPSRHGPQVAEPTAPFPPLALLPVLDDHYVEVFVGRDQETVLLQEKLNQALAGKGDLFVIEGEAGVGKTRLAYELLTCAIAKDAVVLSADCQALEHQLPFAPIADAICRLMNALPDEALGNLPVGSLSQLARLVPSLQDRLPHLPAPFPEGTIGADHNRQRLTEAIVGFFTALAQRRPVVLFIDDLQWADYDTLAVLSRLSQRVHDLPLLALLAYRTEDLAENDALSTLLHSLRRARQDHLIPLDRLGADHVREMVHRLTGQRDRQSQRLADFLYDATGGNALFLAEALRDLQERQAASPDGQPSDHLLVAWANQHRELLSLRRNRRVQEIILERIERLSPPAQNLLCLAAAIGRDFSLELLEAVAETDPLPELETLLEHEFLVERPHDRLDFRHEVVRQVAYDTVSSLQRRRLHHRIGTALESLDHAHENPREIAFHFRQAGIGDQLPLARNSVLAGEKLLHTFGFRQAVDHFDEALAALFAMAEPPSEWVRRALQGRGLAFEGLLDPDGVADTYTRLHTWASEQGDRQLLLVTYSRFTSMLTILGKQRTSNKILAELFDALMSTDGVSPRSRVIADLLERRRQIYGPDHGEMRDDWTDYSIPPPAATDPVEDILQVLEPTYAVLPLFDYGWTLLVQGQLGEATHCLEAVVDLATETAQPSIASAAYHQLAVTARILGDLEQSQILNDKSMAINREVPGTAAELASMWPRISSAFLSLRADRLDEAERRFRRVIAFLDGRNAFHNYRNSATIGLGLVALQRGDRHGATVMLERAIADEVNFYPYTHVSALLGLSRIAHLEGRQFTADQYLRRALHFAGSRSLLEEYAQCIDEMARQQPEGAPSRQFAHQMLDYVESIQLMSVARLLRSALARLEANDVTI